MGAANAAGVANLKQTRDDMEPEGAFDLVPHCKLAKVYDPALSRLELVISVAQLREHIRGALGNRSESSSRSSSNRIYGTGTVSSDRTELKKVNFVSASHLSDPECDRMTGDKVLRQIKNSWIVVGKLVGTRGSAVSSTSGQLPTSAEIEELSRLSCGASDPEFDAEEDAAREMYSQSDL